MGRRRYRLVPSEDAEYIVGTGIELKPEDDLVNRGKPLPPPVEFIPAGSSGAGSEVKPEGVRVAPSQNPFVEEGAGPPAANAAGNDADYGRSPTPARDDRTNRRIPPLPALSGRYQFGGVIDLFAEDDEIPRPTTKPATVGPAVPPPWPDDKTAAGPADTGQPPRPTGGCGTTGQND